MEYIPYTNYEFNTIRNNPEGLLVRVDNSCYKNKRYIIIIISIIFLIMAIFQYSICFIIKRDKQYIFIIAGSITFFTAILGAIWTIYSSIQRIEAANT